MGKAHGVIAFSALGLIVVFLVVTLVGELSGDLEWVIASKRFVVGGLVVLIPLMAASGALGSRLARGRQGRLVQLKKRRMIVVTANGVLVLAPTAVVLWLMAVRGDFGALYTLLQLLELAAGGINVLLMALMARDGLRLSGRLRRPAPEPQPQIQ